MLDFVYSKRVFVYTYLCGAPISISLQMPQVKTGTILTHVTGWLIFMSLPLLFIAGESTRGKVLETIGSLYYWLFFFCFAIIFYVHTYYLFPHLYTRKRYATYVALVVLMFGIIYLISPFDQLVHSMGNRVTMQDHNLWPRGRFHRHYAFPPMDDPRQVSPPGQYPIRHRGPHFDIISICLYVLTITLSIAVNISREWRLSRQRAMLAETGQAQAELAILKAQIQPHFLFNTLNNIYALAVTNQPNTAGSIMKLSNILRYVTEDASEKFVSLKSETDCIRDYIDLQRLRVGDKTTITVSLPENETGITIAPMIIMTFIENAFKFGISSREYSTVTIQISVAGRTILFFCSNNIFGKNFNPTERLGIGINNTKQRLEHIYKDHYFLEIVDDGEMYTVNLEINTSFTLNAEGNGS